MLHFFFFSSRRRHTRFKCDWSSDVCSSDLNVGSISPKPYSPETGEYGLGDMQPTFFISPKKRGKLIWGVGPVLQLPTATNRFLGQGKLGMGPSTVVLTQRGHWTLGLLENDLWSVLGWS